MHPGAMKNATMFFDIYVSHLGPVKVVDIGSQDVNGSLREVCPPNATYIGLDFERAKGVDIVLTDPYSLPLEDESVDVVVCSSCFEHSEMFWLLFNEVLRILKPSGIFYLNVPANGIFHRYPVDCWRFYPDAGRALVTWAKRSGFNPALLESYTSKRCEYDLSDYVSVFIKDKSRAVEYRNKIVDQFEDFINGYVYTEEPVYQEDVILKISQMNYDMMEENFLRERLYYVLGNQVPELEEEIRKLQNKILDLEGKLRRSSFSS